MTKPSVSEEEMLTALNYLISCTGDVESSDADPGLRINVDAIRALVLDYGRLKNLEEKVGGWKGRIQKAWSSNWGVTILEEAEKIAVEIRDFEEGE